MDDNVPLIISQKESVYLVSVVTSRGSPIGSPSPPQPRRMLTGTIGSRKPRRDREMSHRLFPLLVVICVCIFTQTEEVGCLLILYSDWKGIKWCRFCGDLILFA